MAFTPLEDMLKLNEELIRKVCQFGVDLHFVSFMIEDKIPLIFYELVLLLPL